MRQLWIKLQASRWWRRWLVKDAILLIVTLAVLYPNPALLVRHIQHARNMDRMADVNQPAVAKTIAKFENYLVEHGIAADPADSTDPRLLEAVETFVCDTIPYRWDWQAWGVVDYLPSVDEVVAKGVEDCDGRAVLAVTLLRSQGVEASFVGDPRHVWVRTPHGDTMNPLGDPVFQAGEAGLRVDWVRLLDVGPVGFGVSVFPLGRELILAITGWVLVLPCWPRWRNALAGLIVVVVSLFLIRWAGSNAADPQRWWIAGGFALASVGYVVAAMSSGKRHKRTDPSV